MNVLPDEEAHGKDAWVLCAVVLFFGQPFWLHNETVKMQLFVRAQELHALEVSGNETVQEIKTKVNELEGLPVDDLVLTHSGAPLEDSQVLTSCGIRDLSSLLLEVRLRGGKVHGSLARAGKVKGQTPKVDKAEKKKKKTGRAKRRIQYNRRFVNVMPTFGRKKGPNSNS
ncbi:ubiquitin-60S ribosomal protein L40-like isoform X1 [Branchiostoma floridae]|uniref:Ubiquitin-60S ribosomal protein L40-like isoform X1 n=2 Tax=Branchiostoma floridae TaxID=7739 RepID=A0A9J7N3A9_BRAFL|nr:ubiquitin-60S ribosomal protein L40-like isoform X1 [Branchiostoma floridae]